MAYIEYDLHNLMNNVMDLRDVEVVLPNDGEMIIINATQRRRKSSVRTLQRAGGWCEPAGKREVSAPERPAKSRTAYPISYTELAEMQIGWHREVFRPLG